MGFDLFVHRFRNGETAPYCSKIVEDIFDRDALRPCDLQEAVYSDGRGEIYCGKQGEDFDGFMLSHFGGQTICERVLEIAHLTQSLIFWPSTYIFFGVTDRAVLAHLPEDIRNDGGRVALVGTVDELWRAINADEDDSEGVVLAAPDP